MKKKEIGPRREVRAPCTPLDPSMVGCELVIGCRWLYVECRWFILLIAGCGWLHTAGGWVWVVAYYGWLGVGSCIL